LSAGLILAKAGISIRLVGYKEKGGAGDGAALFALAG
jgi:hypothetical protein